MVSHSTRPIRFRAALLALSLILGTAAIVPRATAADPGDTLATEVAETVSVWLPEALERAGIPGAAAVIVNADGTVWSGTYGHLAGPGSAAVDTETIFCIRSVSKSVTALAVLMAVQDGLVDLDTPIARYLPDFSVHSSYEKHPEERITLRHLLAHRAGFTHNSPPGNPGTADDLEAHIASIGRTWLRFPVGYRLAYSNLDYDLAGYILQERSGKPFAQFVRERVLETLGMKHSSFDFDVIERTRNRATGHDDGIPAPIRFPEIPSAGLYASIGDMAKYMQFHLRGGKVGEEQVLRDDLMAEFHAIQYAMVGQRTGYCFGLYKEVVSKTYDIAHPGGGRGFQSLMILFPELDFGLTLLTNCNRHKLTGGEGRGVISAPIYSRLGSNPLDDSGAEGLVALSADDPRVRGILGRYGTSAFDGNNERLHAIERDGDILLFRTSWEETDTLTIYADGDDLIGTYGEVSEMRFLPPLAGRPGSMMTYGRWWGDVNLHFHDFNDSPFDPPGPDRPRWRRYAGTYDMLWNDIPTVAITIDIRNGYFYYGESKCRELEPGLFLSHDGQVIDFTVQPPTAANLIIKKRF